VTKKELYHLLYSNGVPVQVYTWSFTQDLDDSCFLKRKFTPMLEEIDAFLNGRTSWILHFEHNPLLASRIAATFLKVAFIGGFFRSKYTTPTNIVGYKMESWDNGEAYDDLLNADLLIIDKILPIKQKSDFPQAVFDEFIEDRLLKKKSTFFVCGERPYEVFSPRIMSIFSDLGIKIVSESGVSNVTQ